MNKRLMKQRVLDAIEEHRNTIISIGRTILENPELGYKEFKTAALVKQHFDKLGLAYEDGLAITGVKAVAGKENGPRVAVLGELDSVVCPAHPHADPVTGAAHACGHNGQIASMLGVAYGLTASGVLEELAGSVCFFAVPAEEFVELEYRQALAEQGKISFLGGKQELIANGCFDDIDMAMMVHARSDTAEPRCHVGSTSSAFLGKTVRFQGVEAHAGGAPEKGVNALNAAMAAIMCIHAQRETFPDKDGIRVHPILTKGGDLVNIVPADVRMETFVRGNNNEAVGRANKKVNRAIKGAAYAIGAEAEITELPGYLALAQDENLSAVFEKNMAAQVGREKLEPGVNTGGSTDMGDVSGLLPSIHPYIGGFSGGGHSKEYAVVDEDAAYLAPARAMALTVVDLLYGEGERAKLIIDQFQPLYTKEQYLTIWSDLIKQEA